MQVYSHRFHAEAGIAVSLDVRQATGQSSFHLLIVVQHFRCHRWPHAFDGFFEVGLCHLLLLGGDERAVYVQLADQRGALQLGEDRGTRRRRQPQACEPEYGLGGGSCQGQTNG